jgi:geranylgeranyl pyrophosphate synthase/predicted secreted hydrolase
MSHDDTPRPGSGFESWTVHCQLSTTTNRVCGLSVTFLRRQATRDDDSVVAGHALLWNYTDGDGPTHHYEAWLDQEAVELSQATFAHDEAMDPFLRQGYVETLAQGPLRPDQLFPAPVQVASQELDLDYGGVGRLRGRADGSYDILVTGDLGEWVLTLRPDKPVTPRGENGVVPTRDGDGDTALAYAIPRLSVEGAHRTPDGDCLGVSGTGWYEHTVDTRRRPLSEQRAPRTEWRQCDLQLDNGWDVSVTTITRPVGVADTGAVMSATALVCAPDGETRSCAAELSGAEPWISLFTANTYPTHWTVRIPDLDLTATVRAVIPGQEIQTMSAWGGCQSAWATVEGALGTAAVTGRGRTHVWPPGYIADFEDYLARLHPVTQREVAKLYPDTPDESTTPGLIGCEYAIDGLPHALIHDQLVRPIRHLTGAGKGLRTAVMWQILDLFDADLDRCAPTLAFPELVQAGVLAIDDVEDDSPVRRGRPAVHMVFGVPTTINTATAAYFSFHRVLRDVLADEPELRLRAYEHLLTSFRAGHAGQALDLAGHTALMDQVVAGDEDPGVLPQRIRATHRLKTGAFVRGLAETFCVLAGASTSQGTALGDFCDVVGLAFQITDDIFDVLGVIGRDRAGHRYFSKQIGEDLRNGKVTMPLAHAATLLPHDKLALLWKRIRDGVTDLDTACEVSATLVECGAIQACRDEAHALVNNAWSALEPLLPNTRAKAFFRALGLYGALRTQDDEDPLQNSLTQTDEAITHTTR